MCGIESLASQPVGEVARHEAEDCAAVPLRCDDPGPRSRRDIAGDLGPPAGKPRVIVAHTVKGKGVAEMENNVNWHGKPPTPEAAETYIAEIQRGAEPRSAEEPCSDSVRLSLNANHARTPSPPRGGRNRPKAAAARRTKPPKGGAK